MIPNPAEEALSFFRCSPHLSIRRHRALERCSSEVFGTYGSPESLSVPCTPIAKRKKAWLVACCAHIYVEASGARRKASKSVPQNEQSQLTKGFMTNSASNLNLALTPSDPKTDGPDRNGRSCLSLHHRATNSVGDANVLCTCDEVEEQRGPPRAMTSALSSNSKAVALAPPSLKPNTTGEHRRRWV